SAVGQYDNRGRMTRWTGPQGELTEYTYDDRTDRIVNVTRLDGITSRAWSVVARDGLQRPVDIQMPLVTQGGLFARPELLLKYDPDGNIIKSVYFFGGRSNTVSGVFGLFGELIQTLTDMGGGQSALRYRVTDYEGK